MPTSARNPSVATRFLLYARKSNDREDRQIRSLGDQSKLAHEEAKRSGIRVVHEIQESKSAKRPGQREGFQEMVRRIEAGEADGILCWHPDRLARNGVDGGWILDLLDRGKLLDLHFLTYTFENTPEGKFMLGMIFSQAKYQVDKLVTDVTRGMREVREEGGFPHYAPEGYKNASSDDGRKVVVADPERFVLLRRAVDLILSESYPPAEVMRLLNGWGYRTRTTRNRPGTSLRESSFYRIIHNPFYAGRCRKGDGWYQGKHEPLMSEAEFALLQRVVNRKDAASFRKHDFTFAGGLFLCGNCGCQITATLAKGRHGRGAWIYYHCTNRRGICNRQGTREEILEGSVLDLLRRLTIPESLEPVLTREALAMLSEQSGAAQDAGESMARRLSQAKAERERLLPLLLKQVISNEDYEAGKQSLDEEIRELSNRQENGSTRSEREQETVRNVVAFAVHALSTYQDGSATTKRRVVRLLAEKRVLTPNNPLLEPHSYLNGIFADSPKFQRFEPPFTGSCSQKESLPAGKLSNGRPNRSRIEPVDTDATEVDGLVRRVAKSIADAVRAADEPFPALVPDDGRATDVPRKRPKRASPP